MNKKKAVPCEDEAALSESLSVIEDALRELGINRKRETSA